MNNRIIAAALLISTMGSLHASPSESKGLAEIITLSKDYPVDTRSLLGQARYKISYDHVESTNNNNDNNNNNNVTLRRTYKAFGPQAVALLDARKGNASFAKVVLGTLGVATHVYGLVHKVDTSLPAGLSILGCLIAAGEEIRYNDMQRQLIPDTQMDHIPARQQIGEQGLKWVLVRQEEVKKITPTE